MTTASPDFPDTIYAIQHLAFEDLGALEDVFYQLGFRVRYFEAGVDDLTKALQHKGLTIILGGPIGVYETDDYPFLQQEIDLLKVRLEENLPTLGICLGAQLIAHALGAKVYAGHQKEIGWSRLSLSNAENNLLSPLIDTPVLHWHGDTFDLPEQAELLASSEIYPNQAFSIGKNILALQFHIEVAADSLEKWLIGHTCELRKAEINIPALRTDNEAYATTLESKAQAVLQNYLKEVAAI
ncbi:glutamine amidotransferase [Acinetobacter sp. BSP-28]|uniref:glutamine amidotransferase n=1 Tax=Acinetobacter sp. BSP-28 TaxID=3344661 RepID=UPI0037703A80